MCVELGCTLFPFFVQPLRLEQLESKAAPGSPLCSSGALASEGRGSRQTAGCREENRFRRDASPNDATGVFARNPFSSLKGSPGSLMLMI